MSFSRVSLNFGANLMSCSVAAFAAVVMGSPGQFWWEWVSVVVAGSSQKVRQVPP
jgi:hypothetical protein